MPNRDEHPVDYGPIPYREKAKYFTRNARHIDGGEIYDTLTNLVANRPPKEPVEGISPSQLGGCPRKLWFKLKGYKETTPAGIGTQTTWELGHQYERTMVEAFHANGTLIRWFPDKPEYENIPGVPLELTKYVKPFEFELPGKTPLIGTPDFLIKYNGKVTVADGKTARSDSFQYVGPTQEDLKSEKMDYFWQTAAYLILMNKNVERLESAPPEQGLVFIYNKDNGIPQRELLVEPTRDEYAQVGDKAQLVWSHYKADTLPPCTCADSPWHLEWCDYGVTETRYANKKGKIVNHECCELEYVQSNQPKEAGDE